MGLVFNILSIDGGGILGLYSADVLAKIQHEYCDNQPLSECFNLITGTSTGGIIALALSTGLHANEVKRFYLKYGTSIFKKQKRKWLGIFNNKYSKKDIKRALHTCFGDLTMSNCKCAVCIPSVDVATCQPILFKTNNNGKLTRDENTKLVDIALATSAAPTYFPLHSFGTFQGLADGGLWQNNPALWGLIEAVTYFVGDGKIFDRIQILSIGNPCSSIRNGISTKNKKSSLLKWNKNLVTLPMKVSSIAVDQILSFLFKEKVLNITNYLRINCKNIPTNYLDLELDSADSVSYKKMLELSAQDFNHNKDALYTFFKGGGNT